MPVYVMGSDSSQNPLSLGSVESGLSFHWSLSKAAVLEIKPRHARVRCTHLAWIDSYENFCVCYAVCFRWALVCLPLTVSLCCEGQSSRQDQPQSVCAAPTERHQQHVWRDTDTGKYILHKEPPMTSYLMEPCHEAADFPWSSEIFLV